MGNGFIGGEKPLSIPRGLEPSHAVRSLTGGLVRVLCSRIEVAVLAMFDPGKDLAFGGSVA